MCTASWSFVSRKMYFVMDHWRHILTESENLQIYFGTKYTPGPGETTIGLAPHGIMNFTFWKGGINSRIRINLVLRTF